MSFILGMDTGGTYTDGVVIDPSSKEILCKAKALTTKDDLTVGIKNCINNLDFDKMEEISYIPFNYTSYECYRRRKRRQSSAYLHGRRA